MPKTNLTVVFGRNALNMRGDATITVQAGGEQPLFLATDLVNDNTQRAYITYEPNYWLMDGTYKFAPDEISVGYMSTELSGMDYQFSTDPVLRFEFTQDFDIASGMTLYFSEKTNDYAATLDIDYYDSSFSLIQSDSHSPTSTTFSTGIAVAGVRRIEITFTTTSKRFRHARLFGIA
jgi:hypothetical protein